MPDRQHLAVTPVKWRPPTADMAPAARPDTSEPQTLQSASPPPGRGGGGGGGGPAASAAEQYRRRERWGPVGAVARHDGVRPGTIRRTGQAQDAAWPYAQPGGAATHRTAASRYDAMWPDE